MSVRFGVSFIIKWKKASSIGLTVATLMDCHSEDIECSRYQPVFVSAEDVLVKPFFVTINFSLAKLDFSENVQTGEISSVETTRLARTDTRHDFLAHGDLLRVSLYGRQGRDSVLGPQ